MSATIQVPPAAGAKKKARSRPCPEGVLATLAKLDTAYSLSIQNRDVVCQIANATAMVGLLKVAETAGQASVQLGGQAKDVGLAKAVLMDEIVKLKRDVAERLAPEEGDDLCKQFAPLDFSKGTSDCKIWFDTTVGLQDVKRLIRNSVINPIVYPRLYGKLPKGVLLYGPPGSGKTMIVKAAINEVTLLSQRAKVFFFAPTAAQLKGKYFGESEKMITAMFDCASRTACAYMEANAGVEATSVVFVDEIDSVAGSRSKGDQFTTTTVNALLQVMDGVKSYENVLFIGATNFPWSLDSAILRRFTSQIYVGLPSAEEIYELFAVLLSKHFADLVARGKLDSFKPFCASRKKAGRGAAKAGGGAEPCEKPVVAREVWKAPPIKALVRNLNEWELRAVALDCWKSKYSNSDIDRLFKAVVQQVADQAVGQGTFVRWGGARGGADEKLFVSTLCFSEQRLRQYAQTPRSIMFLTDPQTLWVKCPAVAGGKPIRFLNQTMVPYYNINDANIREVFIGQTLEPETLEPGTLDVVLSFVAEIQQAESKDYALIQDRMEADFDLLSLAFEAENQSFETVSRMPWPQVTRLLAAASSKPEVVGAVTHAKGSVSVEAALREAFEGLIVPGLKRYEVYYYRAAVPTSRFAEGVRSFAAAKWHRLTNVSASDVSRFSQERRAEFLKSLGNLKTLAGYGKELITTWRTEAGSADSAQVVGDASELLAVRTFSTKSPIYGGKVDIIRVANEWGGFVADELGGFVGAFSGVLGKETSAISFSVEPFRAATYLVETKLLTTVDEEAVDRLYRFLDKHLLTSAADVWIRGFAGGDRRTNREILESIAPARPAYAGEDAPLATAFSLYEIGEAYADFSDSRKALELKCVNLNIASSHFREARSEVKSTANPEDIRLLEKYRSDPQDAEIQKLVSGG